MGVREKILCPPELRVVHPDIGRSLCANHEAGMGCLVQGKAEGPEGLQWSDWEKMQEVERQEVGGE